MLLNENKSRSHLTYCICNSFNRLLNVQEKYRTGVYFVLKSGKVINLFLVSKIKNNAFTPAADFISHTVTVQNKVMSLYGPVLL